MTRQHNWEANDAILKRPGEIADFYFDYLHVFCIQPASKRRLLGQTEIVGQENNVETKCKWEVNFTYEILLYVQI